MFVDEVRIEVQAGKGGDGCVSFRRERFVPKGGPDGGAGGRGGDVVFRADSGLNTLYRHRLDQRYAARNGQPGSGRNRTGAAGEDVVVPVPVGTIVRDAATGAVKADFTGPDQEEIIAEGGAPGRGNKAFATSIHQTPREFEKGEEGEHFVLDLELKLIADVGLVGLPNAGKSTLLSRLTAAEAKVASYPFTTLTPQLGIVAGPGDGTLVLADIPGLIDGASDGVGLGHEFLRHIERTSVLAHIVDLDPVDGSDPAENVAVIERELAAFSPELAARPRLLVGAKVDLPDGETAAELLEEELGRPVLAVSAVSGAGLDRLVSELFDLVRNARHG